MSIAIVPFTDEYLEPACRLLTERHRFMREQEVLLPIDFLEPQRWTDPLNATREKSQTRGLVALVDGTYAGHLIWSYDDTPRESLFSPFSPPGGVEVSFEGLAVDPARPNLIRRLYAAASKGWLANSRGFHILPATPAQPQMLEALYGLGFGRSFTFAVRESNVSRPDAQQPGVRFREAMPGDEAVVRRLAEDLWCSYTEPPVHFPLIPKSIFDLHAHADRYVADPTTPVWLAERNGHAEALDVFVRPESEDWFLRPHLTPERGMYLFWASTAPGSRGSGVHTALLDHTARWAESQGFASIALHFLSPSFASEYWQRQGFRPVVHWLSRTIDARALPMQ